MQKITPCLWLDDQIEAAVDFYVDAFKNTSIIGMTRFGEIGAAMSGRALNAPMTILFSLAGMEFLALNGGESFKFTPAVSLTVGCETEEELEHLYNQLSEGGMVLMPLASYPFAEKFAWVNDKYGLSWQLILTHEEQAISPSFLFVQERHGLAEEAMEFWTAQFPESKILRLERYAASEGKLEGAVKRGSFTLCGQRFVAMDGGHSHAFDFTLAVSFIINCESQSEVDDYWAKLSAGGEPGQCGWLTDKYGIAWQVVPKALSNMLLNGSPTQTEALMGEIGKMTRLDLAALEAAFNR